MFHNVQIIPLLVTTIDIGYIYELKYIILYNNALYKSHV